MRKGSLPPHRFLEYPILPYRLQAMPHQKRIFRVWEVNGIKILGNCLHITSISMNLYGCDSRSAYNHRINKHAVKVVVLGFAFVYPHDDVDRHSLHGGQKLPVIQLAVLSSRISTSHHDVVECIIANSHLHPTDAAVARTPSGHSSRIASCCCYLSYWPPCEPS
jgi:hypothetical protein